MLITRFGVAFWLKHECDIADVPAGVLLDALEKRLNFLKSNPQEVSRAFGIDDSYELASKVNCSICKKPCDPKTVHLHQDDFIGDECCWDERLRSSE